MRNLLNPLCNYSGENFVYAGAGNIHTAETSMNWWMNSPSHKQAILDPKYTLTGIGVSHGNIVVQHFCVAK